MRRGTTGPSDWDRAYFCGKLRPMRALAGPRCRGGQNTLCLEGVMTIQMWMAACAWLVLVMGYSQRKHRERHIPLMLIGIFMDIALVLYLQVTRGAIRTAFSF